MEEHGASKWVTPNRRSAKAGFFPLSLFSFESTCGRRVVLTSESKEFLKDSPCEEDVSSQCWRLRRRREGRQRERERENLWQVGENSLFIHSFWLHLGAAGSSCFEQWRVHPTAFQQSFWGALEYQPPERCLSESLGAGWQNKHLERVLVSVWKAPGPSPATCGVLTTTLQTLVS